MKPTPFSVQTYVDWHNAQVAADAPLVDNVTAARTALKADANSDLKLLSQILTYMFVYSKNEFKHQHNMDVSYTTGLAASLVATATAQQYESLFKSVESIINKMWRKAKAAPTVTMANLLSQITDLIRTDVRTETLQGAQFLATRMKDLRNFIYDDELRNLYDDRVESCICEPEMKMESGYFAYHALIRFKAGYAVEVQIYSAFMAEWRKLSHRLYEQVRIAPIDQHEYGTKETRLVSLGHMLHLAECEIERLSEEMNH